MYAPFSACGDYQLDFSPKQHTRQYLGFSPNVNMLSDRTQPTTVQESMLLLPGGDEPSAGPVTSSVWLEQGEYFFDDEFSLPIDENDLAGGTLDDIHAACHQDPNSDQPHSAAHLGQSCADSCICTPGDSGESDVVKTPSGIDRSVPLSSHFHQLEELDPTQNDFIVKNGVLSANDTSCQSQGSVGLNASHLSQQVSRSGSMSWMQQLMERSCNPDLKALLKRAAATADYKLAYTDAIHTDSCTNSTRQSTERTPDIHSGCNGLLRSFSHNNIFTPNDLAGLRCALDQAAQLLTNTGTGPAFPVPARSVTLTSSIGTQHDTTFSTNNLETKPQVTTWAQKHGSRESLKRRLSSRKEFTASPSQATPLNSSQPLPSEECASPWRAIKEANNSLVTWNQLKRTVRKQPLPRHMEAKRESRQELHGKFTSGLNHVNATSDTQLLELIPSRPIGRSKSQPPPSNHYMHRFSGTLLEIFMRAKVMEASFSEDVSPNHRGTILQCDIESGRDGSFPQFTGGDREISAVTDIKYMRHFGAQFPSFYSCESPKDAASNTAPIPVRSSSPLWYNTPQNKRGHSAFHADFRFSHPHSNLLPNRPQSFGFTGQFRTGTPDTKSSNTSPEMAVCLTASAGPDSSHFAALRDEYLAEGIPTGWLRNPRASIAYPGLGILSVPRPSRLAGATFLSHTLPDLSFLGLAGAEEERKGTPTMPKRLASCHCRCHPVSDHCHVKCRCRSSSVGRMKHRCQSGSQNRRSALRNRLFGADLTTTDHQKAPVHKGAVPDLVAGHENPPGQFGSFSSASNSNKPRRSIPNEATLIRNQTEHFNSEPDINSAIMNLSYPTSTGSVGPDGDTYPKPNALMTSSSQACYGWASSKSSGLFDRPCGRPKKSVSFTGNIRHLRSRVLADGSVEASATSPEPKVIPRNWGLYGQEPPLAEFNPRISPGRDNLPPGQTTLQSDVDVRYHAMVSDVIKAVQETVAYYSSARAIAVTPNGTTNTSADPIPYTTVAALGSTGRQPLLAIVVPLTVLLCDGLLPPTRPIFMSKPRTRLWQMVEESCRPGPQLSGVAYRVLSDAVGQVKALTNVTLERVKFKAFICACLNSKALPMWLNSVVTNETLLNRFYCSDAFVRQCRTSLRGLYADLLTHLEQLLAFPFNLDIALEVRKPVGDLTATKTGGMSPSRSSLSPGRTATNSSKVTRASVPPAVVLPRKPKPTVEGRTRMTPSSTSGTANANINHYPPRHLPGQRPLPSRARSTRPGSEESEISSASSAAEPSKSTPNRSSVSRPTPTTSPVRGKLKSALSTFRRTPTPSALTNSPVNQNECHNQSSIRRTGIPSAVESGPKVTPRSSLSADTDRTKAASKLKPPSSVTGTC